MPELLPANTLTPPVFADREEQLRVQRQRLRHPSTAVRADACGGLGGLGDVAIPILIRAMKDSDPEVHIAALDSLRRIGGPAAIEALIAALREGETRVRSIAAGHLANLGAMTSVEALCEALKDPDRKTRIAAAQALGTLGEVSAIPHLLEAHHRCFLGRSARGQLVLGLLVAVTIPLLYVVSLWGAFLAKMGGVAFCLNITLNIGIAYFKNRKEHSEVAADISNALLQIAESSSAPEIHGIVLDLRSVTQDRLQHSKATRAAARETADRIEALTARLQALPVAAGPTDLRLADVLPRAAEGEDPSAEVRR